ncbi:hypothetical protein ANN_01880 [Periplaneta americana]|uniref:Uncharacterized protein n=1 Tax=Periplaneta americana TaxID=6978 RepID=A0ABQ8TXS3_PERAM|nr:hypothetical protein ANN_01880 [Periplaneta americana]
MKAQQLKKNYRGSMESILYGEHMCLNGLKRFFFVVSVLEDEPRSGRPCTSKTDENVTKGRDLVRNDQRLIE